MKNLLCLILLVSFISCGRKGNVPEEKIITVSIAPFKYFIEAIAKDEYEINVMVPAGSNPHIYEPYPVQVSKLEKSVAYISNGFLGFEMTWLDRFYEMNSKMKRLSVGEYVEPIKSEDHNEGDHVEGTDPHYWVSPRCAYQIAASVKTFLTELNPDSKRIYEENYQELLGKIRHADDLAKELSSSVSKKCFMIYHPNLAYLARDYGLEEIAVENEGKEPSPSRMKYLIDRAKKDNIKVILVQKEYDTRNARAVADEAGAKVIIIDPLSEDWYSATVQIIEILKNSFELLMN
jgi:zinc transport system substrate-binding protein